MFGKAKKPVSLQYKEKLLADIAYYEKRIEEALLKTNHSSFDDEESSDEESNPYSVNLDPLPMELRKEEARLSNCTSMTLELAMLTIMQSEVNVMTEPPEVRRPVQEDGTWLEVAAECKIDLVSFTITFYAHKPRRRFAPTRYRSVEVTLAKAPHERELAHSVLAKLARPNLALQVLQSYATAFRSRRTTLLELAEQYADKLKMEAMAEGGYRVRFLELLTVEWTLENMWSPIVPFCHRMKFEVEYMPKDYIHAIGKLYKQFKDPSLQTAERTLVLAKIFDTCLEAQGPARDLQDTFESDPETAGRLHERRTTIDQEPEVPPNCDQHIQVSPQKLPQGKENKAQNRKTTMAPPKSLPKKAKKVANAKKIKQIDEVNDNRIDMSKSSKTNDNTDTGNDLVDVTNRNKPNGDVVESRKGAKRTIDNDSTSNTKRMKTDKNYAKPSEKVAGNEDVGSSSENISSKNDAPKNINKAASSKNVGDKDTGANSKKDVSKKNTDAGKSGVNTNNLKQKVSVASAKTVAKNGGDGKNMATSKDTEGSIARSKTVAKETRDVGSVATSKNSITKGATKNLANNVASAKDQGTEGNVLTAKTESKKRRDAENAVTSKVSIKKVSTKTDAKNVASDKDQGTEGSVASSKSVAKERGDMESVATSKKSAKKAITKDADNNVASANDQGTDGSVASSKHSSKKMEDAKSITSSKQTNDKYSADEGSSKDVHKKVANDKNKAPKNLKDTANSVISSKSKKPVEKDQHNGENKVKITRAGDKTNVNNVNTRNKVEIDNNQTEKPREALKVAGKNKVTSDTQSEKDNDQVAKQKEATKASDKSLKSKVNTEKEVINKEMVQDGVVKSKDKTNNFGNKNEQKHNALGVKNINTRTIEDNKHKIIKNKESLAQKMTKPNTKATEYTNNDINKKNTETAIDKGKAVSQASNTRENKSKGDETVEKVVESNKVNTKTIIKNQNKIKVVDKLQINSKATVRKITNKPYIAKTAINTEKPTMQTMKENKAEVANKFNVVPFDINAKKPTFQKIKENQAKIAAKLKTRIPMMKNKLKIGGLNKLEDKNVRKLNKSTEKTKIPLKSLPVFKKAVRNIPARISPRKLPSSLKPSSYGFSSK